MGLDHPRIDLASVRRKIDGVLAAGLETRTAHLEELGADLAPLGAAITDFCSGGKRIRPLFAYCGWLAAGGSGDDDEVVLRALCSLELVQAAALAHDDVIDESDSRRGMPSLHRRFENLHRDADFAGDAPKYGVSTAILLGDLALIWADAQLQEAGLNPDSLIRVRQEFDLMRVEVMAGQYFDLLAQVRPPSPAEAETTALRVAELKAASYTVIRPMRIGAAIANASERIVEAYTEFGYHAGIAFQLRDDILGVFGDPKLTGKPAGDDLREGKQTVLVARAINALGDRSRDLTERLGRQDLSDSDITDLLGLLTDCGAVGAVEQLITTHADRALNAIRKVTLDPAAAAALDELVNVAAIRSH